MSWVVLDQTMVSGVNFLTGLILARFLGLQAYGQFVLLYAGMLYINNFQTALIIEPMLSIAPQIMKKDKQMNYLHGVITLQFVLTISMSIVAYAIVYVFGKWFPSWNIISNIVPLMLTILFYQLQDWLRRYYFIFEEGKSLFFNDAVSYFGQLALLILFFSIGRLNLAGALFAIALSSAIAFLIGGVKENIRFAWSNAFASLKENWRIGRDLILAGQIQWAGSQGIFFIAAGVLGTQATGGIRAAQNIVGPFNILFNVMDNIVPVRASRHFAENGLPKMRSYLGRVSFFGTWVFVLGGFFLVFFSKQLMKLLYGQEYAIYSSLVLWGILYYFLSFFSRQFAYYWRTVQRTRYISGASLIASIISVMLVLFTVTTLHELSLFIGPIMGQIFSILFLFYIIKKQRGKL